MKYLTLQMATAIGQNKYDYFDFIVVSFGMNYFWYMMNENLKALTNQI